MSCHYKFKSGKEAHTITFDSLHISVGELKKAIMQQRKIGKSADLDLQITNAQTKEVYESDSILIPKNTSVIVARVPVANSKKSWNKSDNKLTDNSFPISEDKITKSNITDGSEDDKIKEMLSQSTKDYDPSKYARGKGPIGPLPPNYTCYRCGKPGHYIKQCPTNNIDVKRSTGIPRSFMMPATADQKGAMITASGEYAVPIIDHDAYREIKKEKPPFFSTENEPEIQKIEIPDDIKCSLCNNLLQDAVMTPCCGSSFCDECIRSLLLDSDNHECPSCKETDTSPDTLIPNRFLRLSVAKFKNELQSRPSADEKKNDTAKSPSKSDHDLDDLEDDSVKINNQNNVKAEEDLAVYSDEHSSEENDNQKTKEFNDGDLYEVFTKEDDNKSLNDKPSNDVKSEKVNGHDITKDSVSDGETNSAPGIANGTIETSANSLSTIPPIHTLQPPYTLTINNNLSRYRNPTQIRVRQSGQPVFNRVPGQMMSRFTQNRTLLPHDSFFGEQMQAFPPMGMGPMPYGYGSQMRGPIFDNMYNLNSRTGPMNPLLPYASSMGLALGGHPVMEADGAYFSGYKFDDYEDKLERFNRQLESSTHIRRHPRRYSRSRSRNGRSKSRSRSYSSSSSRSSNRSRKIRRRPNRYDERRAKSRERSSRDRASRDRGSRSSRRPPKPAYSNNNNNHHHHKRPESKNDKRFERNERHVERNEKEKEREKEKKEQPPPKEKKEFEQVEPSLKEESQLCDTNELIVSQKEDQEMKIEPDESFQQQQQTIKSEEMEIKIQEDYSDLENEELTKSKRDSVRESNNNHDKEGVSKSTHEPKSKEDKTSEESHRRVKLSSPKLSEKPLLSVTIENKAKIGSKISLKDKEEVREKERDRKRDKDKKSDKSKDRAKEKSKDGKSKSKDRHRERDRDHSSRKEHNSEPSSSKSKSKDKKRDKEKAKEKDDRSRRSSRRSRSRSPTASGHRKKIKSEIDTSSSKHKHKSSKSHRK